MQYDPDFDILSLKEPLDKYIEDFCNTELYECDDDDEEEDDFDYSTVPENFDSNEETSNNDNPTEETSNNDNPTEKPYSEDGNIFTSFLTKCNNYFFCMWVVCTWVVAISRKFL